MQPALDREHLCAESPNVMISRTGKLCSRDSLNSMAGSLWNQMQTKKPKRSGMTRRSLSGFMNDNWSQRGALADIKPANSPQAMVPLTTGKMPWDLTDEERTLYPAPVADAKYKEFKRLHELGCYLQKSRSTCHNIIDS